jgi:hypothetical protein
VLDVLEGNGGLALIVAAFVVAAGLEVLDERADASIPRGARFASGRPRSTVRTALRVALAVLVLAALAATVVRVLPVLGD